MAATTTGRRARRQSEGEAWENQPAPARSNLRPGSAECRFADRRPMDAGQLRSAAGALWHRLGVLVLWPDQLRGLDVQVMESIGTRVYGERDAK